MNIEKERNNMSEVPVSNKDLDEVIYKVTRDVIEEKAVNGLVSDVDEKARRRELVRRAAEQRMHSKQG